VHGDAKLSSTGNSFAALAGSANGEIQALMDQGTVSKLIMEEVGLNLASVMTAKMFGDSQVELNCMVADFGVTDGLMRPRIFLIDTDAGLISMGGDINLATEAFNITIQPQSKKVRLFSLRSPLYLRGTFKKPDVGVDKAAVGLKAGAAIVLGAVATPLGALLALTQPGQPGTDSASHCGTLLESLQQKPVAPAPGGTRN
jgi:uncharacterized protein involved in outer membrane biogenesis